MPETVRMVLQSIGNARLVAEVDRDADGTFHFQDWDTIDQWIDYGVLDTPRTEGVVGFMTTSSLTVPTGWVDDTFTFRTDPLPESVLDALRQSTAKAVARVRKRKPITPTGPLED